MSNQNPTVCPLKENCPMYDVFVNQASIKFWQIKYCDNEYEECERYKCNIAAEDCPSNMLPNGKLLD